MGYFRKHSRHLERARRCRRTQKICYPSEVSALRTLTRRARESGEALRVYLCPHCEEWHLTSRPLREREAGAEEQEAA